MVGPLALLPAWQDENRNYSPSLSENLSPDPSRFVTTQVLRTKQKPKKPLALDAKCLWRDIDAMAISKSLSKLSDFQPAIASPYRVLHQVQGDKQEINPFSSEEVHRSVMYFH